MSEFCLNFIAKKCHQLQINARTQLKQQLEKSLEEENSLQECFEYSSPTRLSVYIKGLPEKIKVKTKEIKGPKVGVPENILQSFANSHVSERDLFKRQKIEFYFIKIPEKIF